MFEQRHTAATQLTIQGRRPPAVDAAFIPTGKEFARNTTLLFRDIKEKKTQWKPADRLSGAS